MMNRASRSYGPVELRSAAGVLPLVRLTLAHRDGMEGMATRLAGLQSVWKSRQPLRSGSFREAGASFSVTRHFPSIMPDALNDYDCSRHELKIFNC